MRSRTGIAYRDLATDLRDDITSGRYGPDTPLPTELALAAERGISRHTVRRAFQELVADHLVYRVPGKGTFPVAPGRRYRRDVASIDDLLALPLDTEMEIVHPLQGGYDPDAAAALQLTVRQMYSLRFRRRHAGRVFCLTSTFLPSAIGLSLESHTELTVPGSRLPETIIGLLARHGHDVAHAAQSVTAVAADDRCAPELGCPVGTPLLHVTRTYLTAAGVPLEHAVSHYLPEMYTLRQDLGRAVLPPPRQEDSP